MGKHQSQIEAALERLQKSEMRRTKPRQALLEFLIREHGPFSIEEISEGAGRAADSLDLVTVYRCLAAFEKIGLVRRCDFGDGVARYEYQASPDHHHHHVTCKRCRRTVSLESCDLPQLEGRIKRLGYSEVTHSLEFFGVCADCRAKKD